MKMIFQSKDFKVLMTTFIIFDCVFVYFSYETIILLLCNYVFGHSTQVAKASGILMIYKYILWYFLWFFVYFLQFFSYLSSFQFFMLFYCFDNFNYFDNKPDDPARTNPNVIGLVRFGPGVHFLETQSNPTRSNLIGSFLLQIWSL